MQVVATNHATDHPNLVHNDGYAQTVGFRRGLVPGVDVYGYLTRPLVQRLGRPWLEAGKADVRFVKPVYDGDRLDIDIAGDLNDHFVFTARCDGEERSVMTARLGSPTELRPEVVPRTPIAETRLKASRESFKEGMTLGSLDLDVVESDCRNRLAEVGETLELYIHDRLVHPAHLLQFADNILAANVELPPWLHVGSVVHNFGVVHWNESISVRARVVTTFVRRGHEFIQLDVQIVGSDGRTRLRVSPYTAIYKPGFVNC